MVEAPPDAGPPQQTASTAAVSDAGTTVQASTTQTPDNPVQPAGPAVVTTEPVKPRTLTQSALLGRIRKLDRDIDTLTQAGQKLSPATRRTLDAIREKAESASTPEERRQVAKELDGWEKFFLRRK